MNHIGLDAHAFGLSVPSVPLGGDRDDAITRYAEELLDDPLIVLLKDLTGGGVTILIPPKSGEDLELALDLAGVNAALWSAEPDLFFRDPKDLWEWASQQPYVVDPWGALKDVDCQPPLDLKAERPPQEPASFKMLVEIRLGGTDVNPVYEALVNGEVQATVSATSRRYVPEMKKILERLLTGGPSQRPAVVLPRVGDLTHLDQEVEFLRTTFDARLFGYRDPEGNVSSSVVQILVAHTDADTQLSTADLGNLRGQAQESIRKGKPVPISISLAIGTRIPSPLKFFERVNLPTYGWLHFAWFCEFINRKVRRVYKPGVIFLVYDEATLFADLMPGLTSESVKQHLKATRHLFELMNAPVDVIEMTPGSLPWEDAKTLPAGVGPEVIYAIACSLPQMQDAAVMQYLYEVRDRPYGQIQRRLGKIWEEAEELAIRINKVLALRKKPNWFVPGLGNVGLFQSLAYEKFGISEPIIDACLTVKEARLVLEPTSGVLLNHGMTVTRRYPSGMHKVHIHPEYRIPEKHPTARPVRLDPRELGIEGEPFVFYYLVER